MLCNETFLILSVLHDPSKLVCRKVACSYLQILEEPDQGTRMVCPPQSSHGLHEFCNCTFEQLSVTMCEQFRHYLLHMAMSRTIGKPLRITTAAAYYDLFLYTCYLRCNHICYLSSNNYIPKTATIEQMKNFVI